MTKKGNLIVFRRWRELGEQPILWSKLNLIFKKYGWTEELVKVLTLPRLQSLEQLTLFMGQIFRRQDCMHFLEVVSDFAPSVKKLSWTTDASEPGQQRIFFLTKDQMLEAQEMFRAADKVTRPEKALILGFMAGSRDHPCPHLGTIVMIKLSENQENVPQTDNTYLTMIVETHFRMNYSTGECKRIKKYRRLEEPSLQ